MKHRLILFFPILLCITSCSFFNDSNTGSGKRVARIGTHVLYESEIVKLMPEGTTSEDSVAMVAQYIDSWALNQLMLKQAKSQLSKSEKNISAEIEDFKSSILEFRYETQYINERLDTLVTPDEIRSYYNDHINIFVAENSIIKGRIVRISTNSPYYEMLKDEFDGSGISLSADVKEHFLSLSEKYIEFAEDWTNLANGAKETGMNISDFEASIILNSSYEIDVEGLHYLIFINGYVPQGAISPYDYNEKKIKEMIISKRKQQLLSDLEKDVLSNAITKKKLKKY